MPSLPVIPGIRNRYPRVVRGVLELALVLSLWVAYSLSRLFADANMGPALERARELLHIERHLGIHWELPLNKLFIDNEAIGLIGSYWYATLHYIVTGAVLLWLYRLGRHSYVPARRALAVATILGLFAYLLMPTAPPRFIAGYVDVLSLHAADGWWGADASAPRGLGGLTNELAAFPSLHAGWALWVAISVQRHARWHWLKGLAWAYAAGHRHRHRRHRQPLGHRRHRRLAGGPGRVPGCRDAARPEGHPRGHARRHCAGRPRAGVRRQVVRLPIVRPRVSRR